MGPFIQAYQVLALSLCRSGQPSLRSMDLRRGPRFCLFQLNGWAQQSGRNSPPTCVKLQKYPISDGQEGLEMESTIHLVLVSAPDETTINDPEYQKQLGEFYKALQDGGVEASPLPYIRDSAPDGVVGFQTVTYLGVFGIPLAKWVVPALKDALVAWLKGALRTQGARRIPPQRSPEKD
jgi:hypothetical protein